jgi:hypothetical protein
MIPCKGNHCIVTVSKEWAQNPPPGWTRMKINPGLRPGRPPGEGIGKYLIVKPVARYGTMPLLRGDPLLRFEEMDISPAFAYVIKFMTEGDHIYRLSCASEHKRLYFQYLSLLIHTDREPIVPDTYETFKARARGFLKLSLKRRWQQDHLELFYDDETEYSIVGGCWFDARTGSILRNHAVNQIKCVMLDTTWDIMRLYITAYLVAISRNTAIPLGFAFGAVEDCELYVRPFGRFFRIIFRSIWLISF